MEQLGEHAIDGQTQFCTRCGAGRTHIVDRRLVCLSADTPNVIAISHIIAERRAADLYGLRWSAEG